MSELTFNIADYRPPARARTHDTGPAVKARSGSILLRPNSEPREYEPECVDRKPAVVDIRAVREAHRDYPRRGKILRFSRPASHRVYTMPVHDSSLPSDDDPGPLVA